MFNLEHVYISNNTNKPYEIHNLVPVYLLDNFNV